MFLFQIITMSSLNGLVSTVSLYVPLHGFRLSGLSIYCFCCVFWALYVILTYTIENRGSWPKGLIRCSGFEDEYNLFYIGQ